MKSILVLFILSLSVSSFAKDVITVMTYNVENLFDSIHDPGKDDWARLPLSEKQSNPKVQEECKKVSNPYYRSECFFLDWNPTVVNQKVQNIGKVISSYNNGLGPDIVVLQEVENIRILKTLNLVGLRNMGYNEVVLLEGPDTRGIDVAILSRFPLDEFPRTHLVDLSMGKPGARPTRSILEATFKIGRKKLTIFANHWPSQSNPDMARWIAAKTLQNAAKLKHHAVIAAGDFNTLTSDNPNGIADVILNQSESYHFYDTRRWNRPAPNSPDGTHWYRGDWDYLDKILVSANSVNNQIDPISFRVYAPEFAFTERQWYRDKKKPNNVEIHKIPQRFDSKTGEGFSDHLPAVFKFEM